MEVPINCLQIQERVRYVNLPLENQTYYRTALFIILGRLFDKFKPNRVVS